jgi:hypothetical protein
MNKIGTNCEDESPAKLVCANFQRYKNLPYAKDTLMN